MAGIASGAFSEELLDAAYRQALAIESGERVVVGVNRYPAASEPLEVFRIDPAVEAAQVAAVAAVRARRGHGIRDDRRDRRGATGGFRVLAAHLDLLRGWGRTGFARSVGERIPCRSEREASPSPVYGAALLMRFGLNAHRGFKSLRLRAPGAPGPSWFGGSCAFARKRAGRYAAAPRQASGRVTWNWV